MNTKDYVKSKFSSLVSRGPVTVVLAVISSLLFVSIAVNAATTISTDITTGGALSVTGLSTLSGGASTTLMSVFGPFYAGGSATTTIATNGDFAVNTNKFTVTAASGNTAVAGTLGVTGQTTLGNATSTILTANTLYVGTAGTAVTLQTSGSATVGFAAILAGNCAQGDTTITVNGAAVGDPVFLGLPNAYASSTSANLVFQGWVTSTTAVTVKACNTSTTTTSYALSGQTIKASVWH